MLLFFHTYKSIRPQAWHRVEVTPPATPEGRGQEVAEHPRTPAPLPGWGRCPPQAGGRRDTGGRRPHGPEPRETPASASPGLPGGTAGEGATGRDSRADSVLAFRLWVGKSNSSGAWAAPRRHPALTTPQVLGQARSRAPVGASPGTPTTPCTPRTPCTHVPHAPHIPRAPHAPPCTPFSHAPHTRFCGSGRLSAASPRGRRD